MRPAPPGTTTPGPGRKLATHAESSPADREPNERASNRDVARPARNRCAGAGTSPAAPARLHAVRAAYDGTANRVAHEQLQRHQARRRQRRAKLRSWRPRQGATHRRLIALLAALVLVFLVVGARLVDLQAIGRDRYAQLGLDQRVRKVQLAAERAACSSRNGHDLAASVPQQTVWANPRVVTDPAAYAAQLAPIVGGDEASLRDRLSQHDKGFVYAPARSTARPR